MIVIGKKYKINEEKLKEYSKHFGWEFEKLNIGYITILYECDTGIVPSSYKCYTVKEHMGYYPEDCLIDERYEKLKKILNV